MGRCGRAGADAGVGQPTLRLAATAIAGGAGLALLAERAWRAAIVDGSVEVAVTSRAGDSGLTGRVYGIRTALLDGGITSTPASCWGSS